MKLSERLKQPRPVSDVDDTPEFPTAPTAPPPSTVDAVGPSAPVDPLVILKQRAQDALFARLGTRLFDASLSETQLHAYVMQEL